MDPVGNLIMAFGNLMVALRIVVVASMRLNRELPPAPAKSGNETHRLQTGPCIEQLAVEPKS